MIEVFKTNIEAKQEADKVLDLLIHALPESKVNFDLDDCDKILRIKSDVINPDKVIELVVSQGFVCEILEN
jgi:hypothetical protein